MTERFHELSGETADEAAVLLGSFKTLQMATASVSGVPEASYAPFVRTGDNAFYICVSDLSRHTGHLVANGRASVLIVEDESASPQLFTRRRLVFECGAEQVERGSERWRTTMDVFERKFGEVIGLIRPLADFRMFALDASPGSLRQGFRPGLSHRRSRARCVSPGEGPLIRFLCGVNVRMPCVCRITPAANSTCRAMAAQAGAIGVSTFQCHQNWSADR